MLKKACASSSSSVNSNGSTVTFSPTGAYMRRIRFKTERDTYTLTRGACTPWYFGFANHAASQGRPLSPPVPKWRTRPPSGFSSDPSGLQFGIIMFSNNTDTVCDFPDPWTPHTIAENGAF
jgi:hypothetical protein